jgi:plasmid stabilization system protein ParE
MSYTVLWKPAAERQLTELWIQAADQGAVAAAADRIDALLKRDPETAGESRPGGTRILILPPLAVHFRVLEADRLVYVASVWRWGRPGTAP